MEKKIILGITGSIAAYKAATLVRLLVKNGAEVKIVMTPYAKEFISPLTLATLSKNPILVDFFNPENGDWNIHVDLGLWADAMLIAPATANTMAKMANGICDNLLLTTYLSAKCPIFVAPAMDLDMYSHPATQENIAKLTRTGVNIIEPDSGELASGLTGKGRMAEPESIISILNSVFSKKSSLFQKKIIITAGPTYEAIDPVRFIGNHSSGKMGYALALEMAEKGAEVILISGQTNIELKHPLVKIINIQSANDMFDEAVNNFPEADVAIMAAAVADYTPVDVKQSKLKKQTGNLIIELKPTKDIAAELGKMKLEGQILLGFAFELENEIENSLKKLEKKNLDFIVLNSLKDKGAGFKFDTNKISIFDKEGNSINYDLKNKTEVAKDIVEVVEIHCAKNKTDFIV